MNKCPKCGTEFAGTFCPECGTKWLGKKTCPGCGRSLPGSAKFCTYCGKSFYAPPRPAPKPKKKRSFKRWVSEHKKLFGFLIAALVLALILSIVIPIVIIHRHDGTYYLYSNEQYDYETYYILKGHSYTDEDGYTGDVEFDGNQIRLYAELFGMRDVAAEGTIDGDVIKLKIMGAEVIYAQKGAMHEHEFGDWRVQAPSTCVEYGTERRFCKGCGKTETRSIPLAPHKGDWNITKEATCTETGTREVHCTVCLQYIVETVDMIAHRSDSWETDDSAHWQICTMCKEEFNRGEHNVDYDEWEYGRETHWHPCTACGRKYEEAKHTYSNKDWCDICGLEKGTYGLEFVLQDGGYAVTGIGECTASEIVIPNVHGKDHLPVTSIGRSAFSGYRRLTSVAIPNSVTKIGDSAFSSCSGLTSVTIGSSVTWIGSGAFSSCSGLTEITIPDSVTWIGSEAFRGCNRMKNVYFEKPNKWKVGSDVNNDGIVEWGKDEGEPFVISGLEDPTRAAVYLTDTYVGDEWSDWGIWRALKDWFNSWRVIFVPIGAMVIVLIVVITTICVEKKKKHKQQQK